MILNPSYLIRRLIQMLHWRLSCRSNGLTCAMLNDSAGIAIASFTAELSASLTASFNATAYILCSCESLKDLRARRSSGKCEGSK